MTNDGNMRGRGRLGEASLPFGALGERALPGLNGRLGEASLPR